jgi:hypothetical protein
MKLLHQITLSTLLLLSVTLAVAPQTDEAFPTRQQSEFANARPQYCWLNHVQFDQIKQHIPTDKTIIVIARLGDKDSKPNLNKRRLHNIRVFLTAAELGERYKHSEDSIILAEGEPTKGYGQIEFYLNGRLIEVIKVGADRDLFIGDCYGERLCSEDWEKLFYPCKDQSKERKQKRKVVQKKRRLDK